MYFEKYLVHSFIRIINVFASLIMLKKHAGFYAYIEGMPLRNNDNIANPYIRSDISKSWFTRKRFKGFNWYEMYS